jgi:AcrR family transcriptional regulator
MDRMPSSDEPRPRGDAPRKASRSASPDASPDASRSASPDASRDAEPAPRRKLLRAPERAASILAAASAVFAARGYTATSLDDIAAAAGVSKLIVYRHFGSKRDLYLAILDRLRERLDAIATPPGPVDPTDPPAALRAAIATLAEEFAVARSMPDAYRLLLRHARREPEFADYLREVDAGAAHRLDGMLAAIPDRVVRDWLAGVVSATVDEAFLAWLDAGDPDRDEEMITRTAYLLGAIVGSQLMLRPRGDTPSGPANFAG